MAATAVRHAALAILRVLPQVLAALKVVPVPECVEGDARGAAVGETGWAEKEGSDAEDGDASDGEGDDAFADLPCGGAA